MKCGTPPLTALSISARDLTEAYWFLRAVENRLQMLRDEQTHVMPETAELRARLVEATQALGEQERVVTTFYFYDRLTLREIGGSLNLTEGRISQILHSALVGLRKILAEESRLSERIHGR
jgi:RNA polymerase sigma factor (sigma-70 family)